MPGIGASRREEDAKDDEVDGSDDAGFDGERVSLTELSKCRDLIRQPRKDFLQERLHAAQARYVLS